MKSYDPVIPKQAIPASKKTKDWYKRTTDAYIELSETSRSNTRRRDNLRMLYNAYNGIVEDHLYTHVLKPYGKKRENMPAKLNRYNIIQPLINQLLGERKKRPFNFSVGVTNYDAFNKKMEARTELLRDLLKRKYADILEQMQIAEAEGQEMEEDADIEEIMKQFDAEYNDTRAIAGQQALEYIKYHQELKRKFLKGFKDFLIAGEVYSERNAVYDEPVYNLLNPFEVDFDMNPDLDFVEDGEWALVREYVEVSSVIDNYYEELKAHEIADLETGVRHQDRDLFWQSTDGRDQDQIDRGRNVEVVRLYWKSRKKIGLVSWMEDGELFEKEVDETYKLDDELEETVEWFWVNEVHQSHRINGTIYVRTGPVDVQRGSLDNLSKCKLPINGRMASNRNAPNVSLLAVLLPYQISYDVYKYRMEVSVAKSKDIIAHIDLDSIPSDWEMDKFLYYMDAVGIAFTQSKKEGYRPDPQHRTVLDLTVKAIESYLKLLESIVQEMERTVGITRQRQGQLTPYDGKGATEQSIIQSSHITEIHFYMYDEFVQRDLQAMMDYSKPAWINGKKGAYFLDDATWAVFEVDGIEHASAEYAVFVKDARDEQAKVEAVRSLTQPMMQNGVSPSSILAVFESDHFATIRKKMKEAEDLQSKLIEAQQEAEQANIQAKMDIERQMLQEEAVDKAKDRELQLSLKMFDLEGKQQDNDTRERVQEMKDKATKEVKDAELELAKRALAVQAALKREELAVKRKVAARSNRRS